MKRKRKKGFLKDCLVGNNKLFLVGILKELPLLKGHQV
jgi:hypothetical protein